jgi:hypothetical protein
LTNSQFYAIIPIETIEKGSNMPEERKVFESRWEAWDFMRECDKKGWKAGYPWAVSSDPHEKRYAVRYIPTKESK